jgi:hypothetical protein
VNFSYDFVIFKPQTPKSHLMKKLVVLLAIAWFGLSNVNAQEFKIGASLGLPLADAADISSFVLGVDAYYYFTKQDAFFQLGANVGFRNFFIDSDYDIIDLKDGQFLPISAAARLKIFGVLSGGADVGYAVGISDYLDGGFYIRPIIAVDVLNILELNMSYESISDAATWGNFNVGFLFQF